MPENNAPAYTETKIFEKRAFLVALTKRHHDICGFTGVIIVVLNINFELVSFFTLIFAVFE
jgi:hypothetical protein